MAAVPAGPHLRPLALLVAAFVLGGLAFAVGTPLFQNPDEPSHLDLAHHYAHHPLELAGPSLKVRQGTMSAVDQVGLNAGAGAVSYDLVPVTRPPYATLDEYPDAGEPATSGCPAACQNYQYGHPPGWYLAVAPLVWVLDGLSAASLTFALRALNVLLAAVAVPLTWYAARQIWPAATWRPLVAAAAVAFAGPYLATAAAVNNDAAVLALAAATTAVMARVLRQGATVRAAALLGALVGAGLLVKAQFIVVAPLAGLAVLAAPPLVARWRSALAYGAPAGAGAIWWLAVYLQDGSLTRGGSELTAPAQPGPWEEATFPSYFADHLGDLHRRLFGLYGWASVELTGFWQTALTAAAVVLAVAWLAARRWARPTLASLRWWLLGALPAGLLVASVKASFDVYRTNGEVRGLAPRYLYPALPVAALGLVAAGGAVAARLPSRWAGRASALAVLVLAAVAGAGSFVTAATGLYDTTELGRLLERAEIVSPAAAPGVWLGVLALGWLATTGAVVAAAWRAAADEGG
jgi:4-amino-4-deoxy-L-arabinose transferase-like glycosyltransferase